MHPDLPLSLSTSVNAADLVLRQARRLHRHAQADSLAQALPVLRRLAASGQFPGLSLPELHRRRVDLVRRKHLLRLLAHEAGFDSWEAWRPLLSQADFDAADALAIDRTTAVLHLWFADEPSARGWAATHGGRVLRVGRQAVVLPTEAGHG